MQRLLGDLSRRGPNAYSEFIECLIDTEQQHIVDRLTTTEQKLRNAEPKFNATPVTNICTNVSTNVRNGVRTHVSKNVSYNVRNSISYNVSNGISYNGCATVSRVSVAA